MGCKAKKAARLARFARQARLAVAPAKRAGRGRSLGQPGFEFFNKP